jgi:D-alanine-D-alanine ligase
VDFLLDTSSGELFLNEINTTPGSLAFYLWEATGVLFDELATILVRQALDRHQRRRETTFSFAANLLRR